MHMVYGYSLLLPLLALGSPGVKVGALNANYEAIYAVSRGGKVIAEQTTTLRAISPSQYSLQDITKGTHGLASFTGFERKALSRFQYSNQQVIKVEHEMQQKVAFKTKSYQFKTMANNTITGYDKQTFTLSSELMPISAHMLPMWLSHEVCKDTTQNLNQISVPVLKSKRIKTYDFKVVEESPLLTRVDRIYPIGVDRSSQIWLDRNNHCLAVKTRYQEADEPILETKLLSYKLLGSVKNNSHQP